jgi:glutamate-5-semialdehyde dehydrogenase
MENLNIFKAVQKASRHLALLEVVKINAILNSLADKTIAEIPFLLAENEKDLVRMDKSNPKYDRLMLTEKRIKGIAEEMRNVATLPYPVGKILEDRTLPNGLQLQKISIPLGVIGIIYEARPNVTFDCFALCIKSGNAVVLKGGSDAEFSNIAILKVIHSVLAEHGIDKNIIGLLPANREATEEMLNAVGFIDILIPRGSQSLIDYVRKNAKVPIIETGAGIVHAYFDTTGDLEKGKAIIDNSKTRRVSVCNALDCLIIHESRLGDLPELVAPLIKSNVTIYADGPSLQSLKTKYSDSLLMPATEESFGTEFLDYKMAIKTVKSFEEALDYITEHSSKHSEVIITNDQSHIDTFFQVIDAAALYSNASTAFTDGAQFGLGAEIGISTQKLHARGPMALAELTSYKWLVKGNGQIRA